MGSKAQGSGWGRAAGAGAAWQEEPLQGHSCGISVTSARGRTPWSAAPLMVPGQAFAPNDCAAKAEPGILTGMPPVSWQVALLVHLSDSRPGPCRKCLVAFYFLAQKCLRSIRQMSCFPWQGLSLLGGCILALGLGGGSGENEGFWRR